MKRRDFITLLGGAAAAWPVAARAQKPPTSVIGFLGGADPLGYAPLVEALRAGLRDHGYIEGQNISIEYRWAEGQYERLPALAADLVNRKVDIIITQGTPAANIAKQATSTIPIVMAIVGDPVPGIVASYSRPGGNITGSSFFFRNRSGSACCTSSSPKWIGLPHCSTLAIPSSTINRGT